MHSRIPHALATALVAAVTLTLLAPAARADDAADARKKAEVMASALREATAPDAKRIQNVANELAAIGEAADDALLDLMTDPVAAVRRAAVMALGTRASEDYMPAFVQAMGDDDADVVLAVVPVLAKYEGEWPTQALVRYLGHDDKRVQQAVVDALGKRDEKVVREVVRKQLAHPPKDAGPGPYLAALGRFPDKDALTDLITALSDAEMAPFALRGLEFYGAGAIKPLTKWLQTAKAPVETVDGVIGVLGTYGSKGLSVLEKIIKKAPLDTKRAALKALAERSPEPAGKLVTKLARSRDVAVKTAALEVMPTLASADPKPSLRKNLAHKSQGVRVLAAKAVVLHGKPRKDLQEVLIKRYRKVAARPSDANEAERRELLLALGRIGDDGAASELIQALGREDEAEAAIAAFGEMGERAVGPLMFLIKTGDDTRRARAVEALAAIGQAAVQPMIQMLSHPNRRVRNIARKALADMGSPAAVGPVIKLLEDPKTPGREALIALLGAIRTEESARALRRFATQKGDQGLRLAAVGAIGKQPGDAVLKLLREVAATDDSTQIRLVAAQNLIARGDREAVPVLKKMVASDKPTIRIVAALGLGYLAGPEDVPSIARVMTTSPRSNVVGAIRDALKRITFQTGYRTEKQFIEWYERRKETLEDREPRKFKSATMTLPGIGEIAYSYGGEGRPLLVLHGGPDYDHSYLRPGLDQLYEKRTLVYVDLPGRGGSSLEAGVEPTVELDAKAAATLLARLNMRKVDVYGHGWGAVVAAELARRHPKMVSRMVLDNAPKPTLEGLGDQLEVASARVGAPWKKDLVLFQQAGSTFDPQVVDRYRTVALLTGAMARVDAMAWFAHDLTTDPALRQRILAAMGDFDLTRQFELLDRPTLMIYGAESPMSDKVEAWRDELVKKNGFVKAKVVPKAGYYPALENGEAWREAVVDFLR